MLRNKKLSSLLFGLLLVTLIILVSSNNHRVFAQGNIPKGYVLPGVMVQGNTTFNSQVTSGTNAPVSVTIAAVNAQRVFIYSLGARCSAGSSQLSFTDGVGGSTIWSTSSTEVTTTTYNRDYNTGYATSLGNGTTITLAACGTGNTGTLIVQASQY